MQAIDIPGAKAKLDLLKLAGFGAARITEIWAPGEHAPTAAEQPTRSRDRRGEARRDEGLRHGAQRGQQDDAAGCGRPARLRLVRGLHRPALPVRDRRRRRQRAEQQPLLAAAVRARRERHRRCRLRGIARDDVRRAEGGQPGRRRDRRRPVAARHRPARHRQGHALPDRVHRRPRDDLQGERADAADHGRVRPARDTRTTRACRRRSSTRRRRRSRSPTTASSRPRWVDSTARPSRDQAADRVRRVRRREPDPGFEGDAVHRHQPTTTKPVDEATQAAYYHDALAIAFCQPNVQSFFFFHAFDEPARRRGAGLLPDRTATSLPRARKPRSAPSPAV